MYDVVIIGAGAAGLSAALCAALNGLEYLVIEKGDDIATTIRRYSVGKHVMAEPSYLPRCGPLWFAECTREELLARWSEAVRHAQLNVAFQQEVLEISKEKNDVFVVRTQQHTYRARRVIIAIGNQGTQRKLDVPGETLPHVHTQLDDPASYCDQEIVIVGGGDTALEMALAFTPTNRVTLVVRTASITKANAALTQRVLSLADTGQVTIHFSTSVERIDPDSVTLRLPSGTLLQVPAHAVFVAIGAEPPRAFFQRCGVALGPDGTPELSVTYESSVPGLFIIGAAGGDDLIKYAINQGYEAIETLCGRTVEPADEQILRQKIFFLPGTVDERISALRHMVPLLADARNEHLRESLPWSTFRQLRAGKDIFTAGDHIDSCYFVLAGLVGITGTRDRSGTEYLTNRRPGGCFDEVSLFSGQPVTVTARVIEDALLWEVQRLPMLKFLQRTPNAHRILERTSLLRQFQRTFDLDETTLVHLVQVARVKRIEKGGTLFRSGDSQAVYFIRSGPVQLSIEEKGLRPIILSRTPGQSVTETLFLRSGETITVTAIDNVEVVEVSRQDLLR